MSLCVGKVKDTFLSPETKELTACTDICNYGQPGLIFKCRDLCSELYACLESVADGVVPVTDGAVPMPTAAEQPVQTASASVILLAVLIPVAAILLVIVTGLLVDRLCCKRKSDKQDAEAATEERENILTTKQNESAETDSCEDSGIADSQIHRMPNVQTHITYATREKKAG